MDVDKSLPQDSTRGGEQLCQAVKANDVSSLRSVLTGSFEGIDDLDSSSDHWSPLHYACDASSVECVRLLLLAGADVDVRSGELVEDGDCRDDWYWEPGFTPLILASRKGHAEVVRVLIKAGADVTLESRFAWTALHAACVGDHAPVVEELLTRGARSDVQSFYRHFDEELGWHFAMTPLHVASAGGKVTAVECLLQHGADVNASWEDRRTPLFYAAAYGEAQTIGLLCQYGSDPNSREHRHEYSYFLDNTPLHYAARNGHVEAVEMLLRCGAERQAVESHSKETALEMAQNEGHQSIVKLLSNRKSN